MFASGSARRAAARLIAAACVTSVVTAQVSAFAQPAVGQKASVAEALFRDGKKLMDQNKFHEACEKFAGSQREDPGLGTLLHLADCHDREGKTASAWAEFSEAAGEARKHGEADREKFANEHAAALEKLLHRFQIDAAVKPPGLAIFLDGEVFSVGALGSAIPLDPGEHEVVATATGKKKWSKKITLVAGAGLDRLEVPALEDEPVPVVPPTAGPAPVEHETVKGTPDNPTKRVIGIVTGGVGLGLGGLATYYFVTAGSRDSDSNDTTRSSVARSTLHDQAKTAQTFGIVTAVLGGLALGTGVFLIVTSFGSSAPEKSATNVRLVPMMGSGSGGMMAIGSF